MERISDRVLPPLVLTVSEGALFVLFVSHKGVSLGYAAPVAPVVYGAPAVAPVYGAPVVYGAPAVAPVIVTTPPLYGTVYRY